MLKLENISFKVPTDDGGEKEIIKGVNLAIEPDKLVVVTGPNGGGKSTLAKLIAGIEKPSAGRILFEEEDITEKSITERVHIPVVLTKSGHVEKVYNDFHVGENADIIIVAGCGIHNYGGLDSQHDGVHRFWLGKGAKVKYVEKHIGSGDGKGKRILNPVTEVHQGEASSLEMEMTQLRGVDDTTRTTTAELSANARLVVRERLLTDCGERAVSNYVVSLNGNDASADIVSRGVARGDSIQKLDLRIIGNAPCKGHSECDSIIMDRGRILAVPALEANNVDAALVHEAAIGKIAGDQLTKLMTLGLTEEEAEAEIINGFLK